MARTDPRAARAAAARRSARASTSTRQSEKPPIYETSIDATLLTFDGKSVVDLKNGTSWKQTTDFEGKFYVFYPRVEVHEVGLGYELEIEGVTENVPVRREW